MSQQGEHQLPHPEGKTDQQLPAEPTDEEQKKILRTFDFSQEHAQLRAHWHSLLRPIGCANLDEGDSGHKAVDILYHNVGRPPSWSRDEFEDGVAKLHSATVALRDALQGDRQLSETWRASEVTSSELEKMQDQLVRNIERRKQKNKLFLPYGTSIAYIPNLERDGELDVVRVRDGDANDPNFERIAEIPLEDRVKVEPCGDYSLLLQEDNDIDWTAAELMGKGDDFMDVDPSVLEDIKRGEYEPPVAKSQAARKSISVAAMKQSLRPGGKKKTEEETSSPAVSTAEGVKKTPPPEGEELQETTAQEEGKDIATAEGKQGEEQEGTTVTRVRTAGSISRSSARGSSANLSTTGGDDDEEAEEKVEEEEEELIDPSAELGPNDFLFPAFALYADCQLCAVEPPSKTASETAMAESPPVDEGEGEVPLSELLKRVDAALLAGEEEEEQQQRDSVNGDGSSAAGDTRRGTATTDSTTGTPIGTPDNEEPLVAEEVPVVAMKLLDAAPTVPFVSAHRILFRQKRDIVYRLQMPPGELPIPEAPPSSPVERTKEEEQEQKEEQEEASPLSLVSEFGSWREKGAGEGMRQGIDMDEIAALMGSDLSRKDSSKRVVNHSQALTAESKAVFLALKRNKGAYKRGWDIPKLPWVDSRSLRAEAASMKAIRMELRKLEIVHKMILKKQKKPAGLPTAIRRELTTPELRMRPVSVGFGQLEEATFDSVEDNLSNAFLPRPSSQQGNIHKLGGGRVLPPPSRGGGKPVTAESPAQQWANMRRVPRPLEERALERQLKPRLQEEAESLNNGGSKVFVAKQTTGRLSPVRRPHTSGATEVGLPPTVPSRTLSHRVSSSSFVSPPPRLHSSSGEKPASVLPVARTPEPTSSSVTSLPPVASTPPPKSSTKKKRKTPSSRGTVRSSSSSKKQDTGTTAMPSVSTKERLDSIVESQRDHLADLQHHRWKKLRHGAARLHQL